MRRASKGGHMPQKSRKGVGNIHTHHLIGTYIPDKIFKQQVESRSKLLSNEWLVKYILGFPLFQPLIALFMGGQAVKTIQVLKSGKISTTRKVHLDEMNKAQIDYSIVLLLDYSFAAKQQAGEKLKPYDQQLAETAESCAKTPFRFFLFHAFDPRRENAMDLLKVAYDKYAVVGIKMYPALGFHPIPEKNTEFHCADESKLNPDQTPAERLQMLKNHLEAMYEFAGQYQLPIITHCGPGGSHIILDHGIDPAKIWEYTDPNNFTGIARTYQLRVGLAHMGGKIHMDEKSKAWRENILENIRTAHQWQDSQGRIYTDLSYDICSVLKDKEQLDLYIGDAAANIKGDTLKYLEDEIISRYVMFGNDWPMGLYSFSDKEYIQPYRKRLAEQHQEKFFHDNLARFLFGEFKQIPDRYIRFIEARNKGKMPSLPDWVRKENDNYFLV